MPARVFEVREWLGPFVALKKRVDYYIRQIDDRVRWVDCRPKWPLNVPMPETERELERLQKAREPFWNVSRKLQLVIIGDVGADSFITDAVLVAVLDKHARGRIDFGLVVAGAKEGTLQRHIIEQLKTNERDYILQQLAVAFAENFAKLGIQTLNTFSE